MKDELNAPSALVTLKAKDRFQQILFACRIRKYNKRFKSSERALLISGVCEKDTWARNGPYRICKYGSTALIQVLK